LRKNSKKEVDFIPLPNIYKKKPAAQGVAKLLRQNLARNIRFIRSNKNLTPAERKAYSNWARKHADEISGSLRRLSKE